MAQTLRVYRIEDDAGYGPVPRSKVGTSQHSSAILHLLRDLGIPPLLRPLLGRRSLASGLTRRDDWAFGIVDFNDLAIWKRSWLGKGCALSVYDVPRALVVEGEGEVLFWRGRFRNAQLLPATRRHPSGLAPALLERIPETAVLRILESPPDR
jgi:hypothetical protein